MKRTLFTCTLFLLVSTIVKGQSEKSSPCSAIKAGTFYYYTAQNTARFKLIRDSHFQQEIDLIKGDTSFWKIKWLDECFFSLAFIRDSDLLPAEQQDFMRSHITLFQVQNVTKDYYIFRATLDSINHERAIVDTVWLRSK